MGDGAGDGDSAGGRLALAGGRGTERSIVKQADSRSARMPRSVEGPAAQPQDQPRPLGPMELTTA